MVAFHFWLAFVIRWFLTFWLVIVLWISYDYKIDCRWTLRFIKLDFFRLSLFKIGFLFFFFLFIVLVSSAWTFWNFQDPIWMACLDDNLAQLLGTHTLLLTRTWLWYGKKRLYMITCWTLRRYELMKYKLLPIWPNMQWSSMHLVLLWCFVAYVTWHP